MQGRYEDTYDRKLGTYSQPPPPPPPTSQVAYGQPAGMYNNQQQIQYVQAGQSGQQQNLSNMPQQNAINWNSGLCGCFEDLSNCCITCCCPCITFGDNMEIIEGQNDQMLICCCLYFAIAWFTGCQCILGMYGRDRLRKKYNLPEEPCHDILVHCCCHPCALCQEARFLKDEPRNVPYSNNKIIYVYQQTSAPPFQQNLPKH